MTFRKPTVFLAVAAVAAATAVWLRRPAAARASLARDAVAPYARAAAALRRPGGADADLRAENDRLRAELQRLRALEEENAALRLHLGFVARNPSLIAAEVVGGGAGDAWSRRLRLGKGRNQGIPLHAPVLAPEGLVGHVVDVTDETADVLLVSDPNSHVACQLPDVSGAALPAIATGTGVRRSGEGSAAPATAMRADYIDVHGSPALGGLAVTSGLGGLYPAGVAVGTVLDVSLDTSGLYWHASLAPAAPLDSLRVAFVLVGWEGTR